MNFSQLEHYVMACQEGCLSEVARRAHLTQQAVSSSIAALERELGIRLFDRGPAGVRLTLEGRRLLPSAEAVLDAAALLAAQAVTLNRGLTGSITLAYATCTIRTSQRHPNQADLNAFTADRPNLNLRTFEAASDACLALAAQGTADLALVAGRPDPAQFSGKFLEAAELALCVAADHPFAARDGNLSYADLRNMPQLLPPDLNYSLRATNEACQRWGFEPTYLEMPNVSGSQVDLVAAGYAVAFMPDGYEEALENDEVRLIHMCTDEACHIPLWLAWPVARNLSAPARAFVDYFVGLFIHR